MTVLAWCGAVLRRRSGRLLAVAAGIAVAVALLASIGSFLDDAKHTMTERSASKVAVDWQVEAQPGADPAAVLDEVRREPGVTTAAPVELATTTGLQATTGDSSQTTGGGVVVGIPDDYGRDFAGMIRPIIGAPSGVLLPQQTAANLHATPGTTVRIARPGAPDLDVVVDGVVELPHADSLFQHVGAPPAAQPQAPPDNVVLLPLDAWHHAFDAVAEDRPELAHHQVHVRLDRHLPTDPAAAFDTVLRSARHLDVALAGTGTVGNNLAAALDAARTDALYAQLLFVFLGLPGAVIACVIAAAVASAGADRRRSEQAILRTRGASTAMTVRLYVAEGVIVGAVGAAGGLALGYLLSRLVLRAPSSGTVELSVAWGMAAAVAGMVTAVFVIALPAWRTARRQSITAARRSIAPTWRRPTLIMIGVAALCVSAYVYRVTSRRGYSLVLAPEGVTGISVSYWAFVAPAALWLGAAILTYALSSFVVDRGRAVIGVLAKPLSGNLASTVAATMQRQRAVIARTSTLVALTVAFAVSTAAFNDTYRQQAEVEARLTNGADVSAVAASGDGFTGDVGVALSLVPGVAHVEPLQHRYAYVGADLQDLFGVRPSSIVDATRLQNAYFTGGTARNLVAHLGSMPDGLLVSAETVRDYQLQLGDPLVLRVQTDQGGEPVKVPFHYLGVVNEFPTAPRDSFVVANADYVAESTGHNGTDVYLVDTNGASPTDVAAGVRAVTGNSAVVNDITTTRTVVGSTLTAVDLGGLTRIELLFALVLLVAASGLALALGLTDRRRSFAIATALGAKRRQVGSFVWTESAFVAIFGIGTGLFLAWLLTNLLVTVLTGVFDPAPETPVVPWAYLASLLVCAAVAVTAATTVAIWSARRAPLTALRST